MLAGAAGVNGIETMPANVLPRLRAGPVRHFTFDVDLILFNNLGARSDEETVHFDGAVGCGWGGL